MLEVNWGRAAIDGRHVPALAACQYIFVVITPGTILTLRLLRHCALQIEDASATASEMPLTLAIWCENGASNASLTVK